MMTNKELKRCSYILSKQEAGVILSETEQQFWNEHCVEYMNSEYHAQHDQISGTDADVLRKMFKIPDEVDVESFLKETKNNLFRKKFANKLK